MKKNWKKHIAVIMLLGLLLSSTVATINAAYYSLNVTTFVTQEKSEWCWAAASEMAGGANRVQKLGLAKNVTQWALVTHFFGSGFPNKALTEPEIPKAANYAYDKTGASLFYMQQSANQNWYFYENQIAINKNCMILVVHVYQGHLPFGKHALTLRAIETSPKMLYYIDPSQGISYSLSFSSLSSFVCPNDAYLTYQSSTIVW